MPETISTTLTTGITLNSTNNPLTITSTGVVSVSSSGTAIYGGAPTDQVYNGGTVIGSFGIALHDGGLVNNASGGLIDAVGSGLGNTGVALFNGGTVINGGTILAGAYGIVGLSGGVVSNGSGGLIAGGNASSSVNAGIYLGRVTASVTNGGIILGKYAIQMTTGIVDNLSKGTIGGSGGHLGVDITGGGTVTNAGLIQDRYAVGLRDGGTVSNLSGGTIAGLGGDAGLYIVSATGTVVNAGVIENTGYTGIFLSHGGTITNSAGGNITAYADPILIEGGGTVINAGTIGNSRVAIVFSGAGNDRLILDQTSDLKGAVGGGIGSNTLELASGASTGYIASLGTFYGFDNVALDNGALWSIAGSITNADTITFEGKEGSVTGLGLLEPSKDAGMISGFQFSDEVVLHGFSATGETFANGILTVTGNTSTDTLAFNGQFKTNDFTLSTVGPDTVITTDIPCLCAGTRILTTTGEKLVEEIAAGNELVTLLPGGPASRKVTWTGRRRITIARHAAPDLIRPVRIRAGAIAPGVPERDLRLSPHHAVYLDGCLFEAIALINGETIFQEQNVASVVYHHIELDAHDIILADGMPTESFLDTGNRFMFDGNGVINLHPDFRPKGDADFCAPLIREGVLLRKIIQNVSDRLCEQKSSGQKTVSPVNIFA